MLFAYTTILDYYLICIHFLYTTFRKNFLKHIHSVSHLCFPMSPGQIITQLHVIFNPSKSSPGQTLLLSSSLIFLPSPQTHHLELFNIVGINHVFSCLYTLVQTIPFAWMFIFFCTWKILLIPQANLKNYEFIKSSTSPYTGSDTPFF